MSWAPFTLEELVELETQGGVTVEGGQAAHSAEGASSERLRIAGEWLLSAAFRGARGGGVVLTGRCHSEALVGMRPPPLLSARDPVSVRWVEVILLSGSVDCAVVQLSVARRGW